MAAIAFSILAIATGAAAGEATHDALITNNALALATRVDEVVVQPTARHPALSEERRGFLSNFSVEITEAPSRDAPFGSQTPLYGTEPVMEMQVAARTPFNFDVGVARRQVSAQASSEYTEGGGAEVRLGQNLARLAPEFKAPDSGKTAWYMFAASDGRALTWTPSNDPADPNRNLRVQDRAEIGEGQLGVTMQNKGIQASLALVQRTVKTQIGPWKKSRDESFAGLTLTWKR
jgi:hypothetical protein